MVEFMKQVEAQIFRLILTVKVHTKELLYFVCQTVNLEITYWPIFHVLYIYFHEACNVSVCQSLGPNLVLFGRESYVCVGLP